MSLQREDALREIGSTPEWDVLVIGGGATGLGAAVEAASRGYRTLLLEGRDFASGTSSRSTKLAHGGVRYLGQGNVKLVLEALRERRRMFRNAPHLAHPMGFVVPAYAWWELPFYGFGLMLYDLLAGRERMGRARFLSSRQVREALPTLGQNRLRAGILYYDGQFDDARYAIALLRTLFDLGGIAINYAPVTGLLKRNGRVRGAIGEDLESRSQFEAPAKVVINATGVFTDQVRRLDEPNAEPVITVSQGTHVVLPRSFFPGEMALMAPRTSDGRILFAIPWHGHVMVGTTDIAVEEPDVEPEALAKERQFLLAHIEEYLGRRPAPGEILSIWSGQRPLVRRRSPGRTAALSRDHTILISDSKLVTITGGKWTTYRKMGEDVIDRAAALGGLPHAESRTAELKLHGAPNEVPAGSVKFENTWESVYGTDLPALRAVMKENPELSELLHPKMPFRRGEVIWAARYEMARCVEDVLARRTRALFLDAKATMKTVPIAARLLARELGKDLAWEQQQAAACLTLAERYVWRFEIREERRRKS